MSISAYSDSILQRNKIASRDPEVQRLWQEGLRKIDILRKLGYSRGSHVFGTIDPTPQPLGCYAPVARAGETPEQRAFRRFRITSHK